jgi:cell cycle sensor histidine kinase DivJ
MIHESGTHLLSLVGDLLDISKIEAGRFTVQLEPCEIDQVVRAVVETLRPQAEAKGLTIATSIDADLPDVLVDRRAMRQILINLVANACKFTDQGGITVFVKARTDGIVIGVADTGVGIAPEHLSRIGEPLFQVKTAKGPRNDGVGLGLSIVRGLVELHQGELGIDSRVGEGSCFTVTLPVSPAQSELRGDDERRMACPASAVQEGDAAGMPASAGEGLARDDRLKIGPGAVMGVRRPTVGRQALRMR